MKCTKCSNEILDNTKFCPNCGSEVKIFSDNTNDESTNSSKKEKDKKSTRNWFMWWKVNEADLKEQVSNYETLSIYKSAKGQSTLMLLLSAFVTFLFISFKSDIVDSSAYLDISLFVILSIFVYRGQKWAMIGAMVLWTLEKVYTIYAGVGSPIMSILWWTVYMSSFWLAYKVELERSKVS